MCGWWIGKVVLGIGRAPLDYYINIFLELQMKSTHNLSQIIRVEILIRKIPLTKRNCWRHRFLWGPCHIKGK
jgi:hypothetical protein